MRSFSLFLIATTASIAAVPHKFEAKTPARAEEVNANFDYLEQGLKGKANQTGLDSVKASLPTLAQWSNLATQPQLKDSAQAIRKSLDGYAKISDLAVYAKDTALSALNEVIQNDLDSLKKAMENKAERSLALTTETKGVISVDREASIKFIWKSGPSDNLWFGGTTFGFGNYFGNTKTYFQAANGGGNIALITNKTISGNQNSTTHFTTSDSSINFPNKVYMTGTLYAPNIVATGIKASNVADYVFDPDHQILPLAEIESFTKENRHLPEVPSAAEIERNGMDIAKMNLILLKKVEELTLHAIAQQKEIDALKASVKNLQAQ